MCVEKLKEKEIKKKKRPHARRVSSRHFCAREHRTRDKSARRRRRRDKSGRSNLFRYVAHFNVRQKASFDMFRFRCVLFQPRRDLGERSRFEMFQECNVMSVACVPQLYVNVWRCVNP